MKKEKMRVNSSRNPVAFFVAAIASRKNRKKKWYNKGFSLVELIIVIAIMAILAAVIAPALIRYIDKSRKAIDVANAELIYKAAEMAATTGSDEAFAGWGYAARYRYTSGNTDVQANILAYTKVTAEGHNSSFDSSGNYYYITCVAWARGINYQSANSNREWENARYKCTLDSRTDPDAANLRQYTDEFLHFLVHDEGNKSAIYGGNGRNPFDGVTAETIKFRYKKDLGHGAAEIWMVCVNCASQTPEIWIGEKNINGRGANRNIRPLYRIYPDPCIEYTE